MQINHSYFNQTLINFNFATAHTFHHLDKFCKAIEKKKILANKAKDQSMMEVEPNDAEHQTLASFNKSGNGSIKPNQIRNAEDIQSRSEEIKEKLMKYKQGKRSEVPLPNIATDYESKDIEQIIFNHFSNQLRPKILLKYPTAPADKINKVILQKWNSLQQAKKDGYTRLTLKKIEAAKQTKKQEQQPVQSHEGEGVQEEVLVKQQAPQPEQAEQKIEAKQNRFGDFLNRIKKNIKGMEEQNERNKPFKEENQNQNDRESRIEEEQRETNEDQANEEVEEKQQEGEQQERQQVREQQQQRMQEQV